MKIAQPQAGDSTPPVSISAGAATAIIARRSGHSPEPLAELSLEELIDRIGDGVVLIRVLDSSGQQMSLGSGFVIDETGLVATCFHVVRQAARILVQFHDGRTIDVRASRQLSPQADLAILELCEKPQHLQVLRLAKEADMRLGQEVVAIGHPSGIEFTPTRGIINGIRKTSELPADARQFLASRNAMSDEEWVQTDAVISPGNSGGPLLNRKGEVVGINSWISTQTRFAFAVHVRHLLALRRQLYAVTPRLTGEATLVASLDASHLMGRYERIRLLTTFCR